MEIVAEMGTNWNNREQAFFMMGQAGALGIKFIKFQLFKKEQVPKDLEHMVIDEEFAKELVEAGKQYGQDVFFTPMYPGAIDMCERIGVKYYKIRFLDNRNLIIYRKIKKTKAPIFVSCNSPKETIYWNMARYQKRVHFLYCVPQYPATYEQYEHIYGSFLNHFDGISDHTPDLKLFEKFKEIPVGWFEMHMAFNEESYERKWSKTFEELKALIGVG